MAPGVDAEHVRAEAELGQRTPDRRARGAEFDGEHALGRYQTARRQRSDQIEQVALDRVILRLPRGTHTQRGVATQRGVPTRCGVPT